MGYYSTIKKWSSNMCYNMDETLKYYGKWKKLVNKKIWHPAWFHLYEMSRIGIYMDRNHISGCLGLRFSSSLAWRIPWMEEPGRLQSVGSRRVGHDWATSLSLFTFMHWRRKWQPTPLFLPGESQGRGSLVGCHLWGCTESDTTEATWRQQQQDWSW